MMPLRILRRAALAASAGHGLLVLALVVHEAWVLGAARLSRGD